MPTPVKVSDIVERAKKAYDRAERNKHYAGIEIISRYFHPSLPSYEKALVQYNRYCDAVENTKGGYNGATNQA